MSSKYDLTDLDRFDFGQFHKPTGDGNCYKCIYQSRGSEENIYTKKKPRCHPLVKDISGTAYEECKFFTFSNSDENFLFIGHWLNLVSKATKNQCYRGNPELYATVAGLDAINCYEISRGYHQCGGYSGHSKANIDKSPGL